MFGDPLGFIRLLQLADSALPIGGAAHSFGIETLTAEGSLDTQQLAEFLRGWMEEVGTLEAAWCLQAAAIAQTRDIEAWVDLNRTIAAMKPARESRHAGAVLGRRFLDLATALTGDPRLAQFANNTGDCHLAVAFGATGEALNIDPEITAAAYLHQSVAGLIAACQKLLPLGQRQSSRVLWNLKPAILSAVDRAAAAPLPTVGCFAPAIEIASMRHPWLSTRLFVS